MKNTPTCYIYVSINDANHLSSFNLPVRRLLRLYQVEMLEEVVLDSQTATRLLAEDLLMSMANTVIDFQIRPKHATDYNSQVRLVKLSACCLSSWGHPILCSYQFLLVNFLMNFYRHLNYSVSSCSRLMVEARLKNFQLKSILAYNHIWNREKKTTDKYFWSC